MATNETVTCGSCGCRWTIGPASRTPSGSIECTACGASLRTADEVFYVDVHRNGEWTLVGQYTTREQAEIIAADYRGHGERARVTHE